MRVLATKAWELFCHFVWPVTCPICGRLGTVGCPSCLDSLLAEMPDRCLDCGGAPFPCGVQGHVAFVRVATWHEGNSRVVVHLAKYAGRRRLAFEMGKAIGRFYSEAPSVTLVPIPLHEGSSRSYNQSACLARGMAQVWGGEIREGLRWTRAFPSQVGRNSFERRALPKDAFRWEGPPIEGPVLLVDDVFTTGTTLLRASEALENSGMHLRGAYCWAVSPLSTLTVTWKEDKVLV